MGLAAKEEHQDSGKLERKLQLVGHPETLSERAYIKIGEHLLYLSTQEITQDNVTPEGLTMLAQNNDFQPYKRTIEIDTSNLYDAYLALRGSISYHVTEHMRGEGGPPYDDKAKDVVFGEQTFVYHLK